MMDINLEIRKFIIHGRLSIIFPIKKLDTYWINTCSNGMINQILEMAGRAGSSVFQKLEILFPNKNDYSTNQ